MNIKEQFKACKDKEEARQLYRQLSKLYHPDLGGDVEKMKDVNKAYESYADRHYNQEEQAHEKELMKKIQEILSLSLPTDVEIELVGSWIWITGSTKEHKDRLKGVGLRWSGQRKRWYWHSGTGKRRRAANCAFEDLKSAHGAKSFSNKFAVAR